MVLRQAQGRLMTLFRYPSSILSQIFNHLLSYTSVWSGTVPGYFDPGNVFNKGGVDQRINFLLPD